MHTIEAVIDRLVVRHPRPSEDGDAEPAPGTDLTRLSDSVETALRLGEGVMIAVDVTDPDAPRDRTFSEHFSCVKCGASLPEIEPRTFSFNSPHGACPTCTGLGSLQEFDPDLILDEERSIQDGGRSRRRSNGDDQDGYYQQILFKLAANTPSPTAPVRELSPKQCDHLCLPLRQDKIRIEYRSTGGDAYYETGYSGVILTRKAPARNDQRLRAQQARRDMSVSPPYLRRRGCAPKPRCHCRRPQHHEITRWPSTRARVRQLQVCLEAACRVAALNGGRSHPPMDERPTAIHAAPFP